MYICLDCRCEFENPAILTEKHNLSYPPYEHFCVCPFCKSTNYKKEETKYCHCCGARLNPSQEKYCSKKCRINAQKLQIQELKRHKLISNSYVYKTVREVEDYNRKNNTRLSYGRYVALIEKSKKRSRKNVKG